MAGARDDAMGMQYLIHGWTFDNKRPCVIRVKSGSRFRKEPVADWRSSTDQAAGRLMASMIAPDSYKEV